MSKGIKVNNGHVNEVATQIETAKSYFRHVPLVPQDSKTTISANSKSKEAYGYAQQGIELLGQTLDGDVHNIRSLNLSFSQFDSQFFQFFFDFLCHRHSALCPEFFCG